MRPTVLLALLGSVLVACASRRVRAGRAAPESFWPAPGDSARFRGDSGAVRASYAAAGAAAGDTSCATTSSPHEVLLYGGKRHRRRGVDTWSGTSSCPGHEPVWSTVSTFSRVDWRGDSLWLWIEGGDAGSPLSKQRGHREVWGWRHGDTLWLRTGERVARYVRAPAN